MDKISFIIPIKDEVNRLDDLMPNLRKFYPNERVVFYANGIEESSIKSLQNAASSYNAEIFITDTIYTYASAGKLFRDIFNIYQEHPTEFLLRIDTDSFIYSPLRSFNGFENSIFGCINLIDDNGTPLSNPDNNKVFQPSTGNHTFLINMPTYLNGVIGFHKNVILNFIFNNTFAPENDEYYATSYINNVRKHVSNPSVLSGIKLSMDYVLSLGASSLNIKLLDHPQIYSVCYNKFLNGFISNISLDTTTTLNELQNSARYSFVHPVNRIQL